MTSPIRRLGLLAVLALSVLASAAIAGGPARFVKIDHPKASQTKGYGTYAYGTNAVGDIVGAYYDNALNEHGFVLRDGTFTSFDYPGTEVILDPAKGLTVGWTAAYAINPQGDIVGQYGFNDGVYHGFLWRNGDSTPINIDMPGQPNTMPTGINPEGTVVGCVHGHTLIAGDPTSGMQGFKMTANGDFSIAEKPGTMHTGINPYGDIVGYGGPSYLIHDGVTTPIMVPNSTATNARGISASGAIVGVFQDNATPTKKVHGFLLRDGAYFTIDVRLDDMPDAAQTRAFGINPQGDIVGWYEDPSGIRHGFLRTTRPE